MAIFKRNRGGGGGEVWYVQVADHNGVKRRMAAFKSRSASDELERAILRLVSARQVNGTLAAEDNRFIESAPARIRDKLAAWGIIESTRAAAGKPLPEHIEDWRVALGVKGNSAQHIQECVTYSTRVVDECSWKFLTDMNSGGFNQWLAGRKADGHSAANVNHHIRKMKALCNWLVVEKRMTENPFKHIKQLNEKADRRLERRAFTIEELGLILAAAVVGPKTHGMFGPVRALLYRTAAETGFRWSELRSLTRASFDFTGETATVTIRAEDAKNGKEATQPLRPELAADLKAHMALFLPAAKAFPGMYAKRGAEMLRVDLESAGVPYIDEYGRQGDFHALRHTFGTLGAKAGIPLATMQKLMRHSDPRLTANIYTHIRLEGKAEALAKLPTIQATPVANLEGVKTGTDDFSRSDRLEILDTLGDTRSANLDGQIRTCANSEKDGLEVGNSTPGNAKIPDKSGKFGGEGGIAIDT